ncbi:MAG: phosphotransferase [Chloroflexota bacterium]
MHEFEPIIRSFLEKQTGVEIQIESMGEIADGPQGYSGALLRYFGVDYAINESRFQRTVIIKDASLVERKAYAYLNQLGLSIPAGYASDLTSDDSQPLCLQHAGAPLPKGERLEELALALAELHVANLGLPADLAWLPKLDAKYAADFLVDACWRSAWESVKNGGDFIDANGNHHGQPKPGGDFLKAFGHCEEGLEAAAETFVKTVKMLWDEGDSLTLIHGDLHGDHVYVDDGKVYIIDWGTAMAAPFYLDLPNVFSRDEALGYREGLAQLGYVVPEETFLAIYDAIKPFVGFKYFGVGLWNWCFGDPPHQPETVMHFIDMIV